MAASAAVQVRRTRAVELVESGRSYDEVAAELGYANRSGAWKAVQAALGARTAESVDEYRALELQLRLDALQEAVWDRAVAGELAAVDIVVGIISRRIRLLGLEPARKPGGKRTGRPDCESSLIDPAYWEHVRAVHPGKWLCECSSDPAKN